MNTPKDDIFQNFFDVWQKQLETGMKDPELVGNMLKFMQNMQQQFIAGQQMFEETIAKSTGKADNSGLKSGNPYDYEWFRSSFGPGALSRSGATANLSPDGDDAVAQLARRLAALEKRIAALESRTKGSGKTGGGKKAGKSRTSGHGSAKRRAKKAG